LKIFEFDSEFFYSIIIYTGDIDNKVVKYLREKVRKEVSVKYPNRLYNSLSSEEEIVYLNYLVGQNNFIAPPHGMGNIVLSLTSSPRASNLIPPKCLAARTITLFA